MRILVLIILLSFFASCNNEYKNSSSQKPPTNARFVNLKLADSLGNVTFWVPIRYDTMFSWTHTSDCGPPCEKIKYRFQPKTLPIFKESGFYYYELKDSIEQFTIVHSGDLRFNDEDDSNYIKYWHKIRMENVLKDAGTYHVPLFDTVEKINDRYFSIIEINLYDSAKKQFSRKLLAATNIKGNGVGFDFELLTKKDDSTSRHFITNSMELVRTIKIAKGNSVWATK